MWRQTIPISVLIGSSFAGFNLRSEIDSSGNLYIGTTAAVPSGFVFIKLDPAGNILFVNNDTTNAPNGFSSMYFRGNMIVMTGAGAGPVIAWDTSGTVLWTASIAGAGYDIKMDEDNNLYLLASMYNQISSTSAQDIVLYKLNSSGVQIWKRDFDFNGEDFPTRFTLIANKLSVIGWGTNTTTGSPYFDWKVFQTDTSGNMLWNADYNGTAFNDEHPFNLVANSNGEVLVTGIGGPSPLPQQSLSYIQMVNVEYSNTGTKLWVDTPNVYGGSGLACHIASDNSLFVSSYYNMTAYHYNNLSLSHEYISQSKDLFQIAPNPFSNKFVIRVSESNLPAMIYIYDLRGKLIKTAPLTGKNTEVSMDELYSGVYLCQIKSNYNLQTFKLIKN